MDLKKHSLVLLLINKGGVFSTSRGLIGTLSRFFNIMDYNDAIDYAIKKEHIIANSIDGFENFSITKDGIDFLRLHNKDVLFELNKEFPERKSFIEQFNIL